jgi:hypothetical protein
MYRNEPWCRESSFILPSRYRPDISRRAGVTALNRVNFLIASISPYSNPEESALPKGWLLVENSVAIWLAEVAWVSRPPVAPRGNNFAKRKGGPRNVVAVVSFQYPTTIILLLLLHSLLHSLPHSSHLPLQQISTKPLFNNRFSVTSLIISLISPWSFQWLTIHHIPKFPYS